MRSLKVNRFQEGDRQWSKRRESRGEFRRVVGGVARVEGSSIERSSDRAAP
jgi:hypothetical protein